MEDPMHMGGQLAALATSLCWASNAVLFTLAGRRVGSPTVNVTRLWIAFLCLVALNLAFFGFLLPVHAGPKAWIWLSLSGLIGFALGDAVLFEAYVRIGPRLGSLVSNIWPMFTVVMAWMVFEERLSWRHLAAIAITLGGLAWVVAGHRGKDEEPHPHLLSGLLLALGGALGQSTGVILSKIGLQGGLHPIQANSIRALAGIAALTAYYGIRGELPTFVRNLRDGKASVFILLGGLVGPVLGVVLSLYAITHAPTGIASTLMALSPILLLPASALWFHERITPRTLFGTLVTLAGVVALFWV